MGYAQPKDVSGRVEERRAKALQEAEAVKNQFAENPSPSKKVKEKEPPL
jgi:hypothetical protein